LDQEVTKVATLTLTDEQVSDLIRQLSPERRREALIALAAEAAPARDERMLRTEARLRELSAHRGLDWDRMNEGDREAFVTAYLTDAHRREDTSPKE
jgi:hypothetical protein